MPHRFFAFLATLALLAACVPAQARPLVDVSVVDRDSGQWLPQHPHRGEVWVAGTPGHRYSVRLANTTGERVLVVLSVDGINAVTGQTAKATEDISRRVEAIQADTASAVSSIAQIT